MKFIKADFKDVEVIHSIVHSTIKEVYPKYYPEGVVDFFLTHHSLENIKKAVNIEFILLIECDGEIVGTGAIYENQIKECLFCRNFKAKDTVACCLTDLSNKQQTKVMPMLCWILLCLRTVFTKKGLCSDRIQKIVTKTDMFFVFTKCQNACKGRKLKEEV